MRTPGGTFEGGILSTRKCLKEGVYIRSIDAKPPHLREAPPGVSRGECAGRRGWG